VVAAAGLLAFLLKDVPLSHHTGLQMRAASEAEMEGAQDHNICRATSRRLGQAVRKVTVPAF
jgi:hypothetical protein